MPPDPPIDARVAKLEGQMVSVLARLAALEGAPERLDALEESAQHVRKQLAGLFSRSEA